MGAKRITHLKSRNHVGEESPKRGTKKEGKEAYWNVFNEKVSAERGF